jgi:hypothetical protein
LGLSVHGEASQHTIHRRHTHLSDVFGRENQERFRVNPLNLHHILLQYHRVNHSLAKHHSHIQSTNGDDTIMDKIRLVKLIAEVQWVRGFIEGYSDKLDGCQDRLDDVLVELDKELCEVEK